MSEETTEKETPRYNGIPKQVSRKDFNEYILPHLSKRIKGPKPKLSFYKIFNYILYVLHTGIQWNQLRTRRNELHWSTDTCISYIDRNINKIMKSTKIYECNFDTLIM